MSTAREYKRSLIREGQKRVAQDQLEAKLLEGIKSGPAIEADENYWKRKLAALIRRHKKAMAG